MAPCKFDSKSLCRFGCGAQHLAQPGDSSGQAADSTGSLGFESPGHATHGTPTGESRTAAGAATGGTAATIAPEVAAVASAAGLATEASNKVSVHFWKHLGTIPRKLWYDWGTCQQLHDELCDSTEHACVEPLLQVSKALWWDCPALALVRYCPGGLVSEAGQ